MTFDSFHWWVAKFLLIVLEILVFITLCCALDSVLSSFLGQPESIDSKCQVEGPLEAEQKERTEEHAN